jgi:Oligosaccharide biosynthesis protein Alg14 like
VRFWKSKKTFRRKRILAVASGGGHWVQLSRLTTAFTCHDVAFVTTLAGYRAQVHPARFYVVHDANLKHKTALIRLALKMALILLWERPHVVISTGAAPGYFSLRLGKWIGADTIWVDSMANVEQLSVSGARSGRHADLWLTQWSHLSGPDGPFFEGSVL